MDILINNAGILRDRSFHKVDLDDVLAVLDVHLTGSLRCTCAALSSHVVLTSSRQ